jgi:hypothetical protein
MIIKKIRLPPVMGKATSNANLAPPVHGLRFGGASEPSAKSQAAQSMRSGTLESLAG